MFDEKVLKDLKRLSDDLSGVVNGQGEYYPNAIADITMQVEDMITHSKKLAGENFDLHRLLSYSQQLCDYYRNREEYL